MELKVKVKILKELSSGDDAKYPYFADMISKWSSSDDEVGIQANSLDENEWKDIKDLAIRDNNTALIRRMNGYEQLLETGSSKTIKRLLDIPGAFQSFVKKNMPNGLVYKQDDFGNVNPYVAINCEYNQGYRDEAPFVDFQFEATVQGERTTIYFNVHTNDLREEKGMTIAEILSKNDILIENDDLNDQHNKDCEYYAKLVEKVGEVYVAKGSGMAYRPYVDRWGEVSNRENKYYFKDNIPNKVIVDFLGVYEDSTDRDKRADHQRKLSKVLGHSVTLPIHTYGNVFHLEEHFWIKLHVNCLSPYEFLGKQLMSKLVLSSEDKELINILMEMSKMRIEDIVKGKTGGSFIIATGEPGTGKTLTAEVFSESIQKALYKVQCSQLGLNIEEVEKNLKAVLARASRWGAILLIDEADVYIRRRGSDINQNAIVGTFLRVLEYYNGILFMTSNMETVIDDAIMSRATAHLQYKVPSDNERMMIWEILSRQFDIEFTHDQLQELTNYFKGIVGRDVKALLKLGKMLATGRGQELTVTTIKSIKGFVPNVNKRTDHE